MTALVFLRDALWGWPTLLLILAAGVYFSVSTRFFQLRQAGRWLKAPLARGGESASGLSRFQALTAALAGSLGTGNIVGVAVALTAGGPGALFWMGFSAVFGMMTVFAETVLAARHREAPGPLGTLRSLPVGGRLLASLYAVGCVLSSLAMGNATQANACAAALGEFSLPPPVTGILLAALVFPVALGGFQRGVRITEKLVPAMTALYFLLAFGVLWTFRAQLLPALGEVVAGAFSWQAEAGGAAGALLALEAGLSRGVFTNEAGLGSSAFAYAEVPGRPPAELGCLGIFQVFLDTLVMCTVTGLCILVCRPPRLEGAALTFYAFESAWGPWGGKAVSLCTALFAAATLLAWSCYGREAFCTLTRGRGRAVYALLAAGAALAGSLVSLDAAFLLGDAMNGLMALPNLLGLFLRRKEVAEDCNSPAAVL